MHRPQEWEVTVGTDKHRAGELETVQGRQWPHKMGGWESVDRTRRFTSISLQEVGVLGHRCPAVWGAPKLLRRSEKGSVEDVTWEAQKENQTGETLTDVSNRDLLVCMCVGCGCVVICAHLHVLDCINT